MRSDSRGMSTRQIGGAALRIIAWFAILAPVAIAYTACWSTAARRSSEGPQRTTPSPALGAPPSGEGDREGPERTPSGPTGSSGNHGIRAFDEAKRELGKIYAAAGQHIELYCGCTFLADPGRGMRIDLAGCGYTPARDAARAERIEWEHAVPAAAFGHTFTEWREGHPTCIDSRGRRFHGRKCARSASAEFARIEADLHNLFPVVGEVNGLRGDLPMGVLDTPDRPAGARARSAQGTFTFGACRSAIERGVFLPRREVRGDLARAYKYMDRSYPERGLIDDAHRPTFDAWDKDDPVDAWERDRNKRITARQGNSNEFIGTSE